MVEYPWTWSRFSGNRKKKIPIAAYSKSVSRFAPLKLRDLNTEREAGIGCTPSEMGDRFTSQSAGRNSVRGTRNSQLVLRSQLPQNLSPELLRLAEELLVLDEEAVHLQ